MANPKRPRDPNQLARLIIGIAAGEIEDAAPEPKNESAAELGRKGGKKRAENMTPERRAEIARKAAAKRWEKG
ncbi:MAG: histone H1 [Pseudomonadota bacterium]